MSTPPASSAAAAPAAVTDLAAAAPPSPPPPPPARDPKAFTTNRNTLAAALRAYMESALTGGGANNVRLEGDDTVLLTLPCLPELSRPVVVFTLGLPFPSSVLMTFSLLPTRRGGGEPAWPLLPMEQSALLGASTPLAAWCNRSMTLANPTRSEEWLMLQCAPSLATLMAPDTLAAHVSAIMSAARSATVMLPRLAAARSALLPCTCAASVSATPPV